MRRSVTISLALLSGVLATAMVLKSNHDWENNADHMMRALTPDALIAHCGQPAADISSGASRQMFYPIDRSVGLIFTFLHTARAPKWTYESSHLGISKGKDVVHIEDVHESESWAIIEMPCLEGKR